jgi:hypothetical protein
MRRWAAVLVIVGLMPLLLALGVWVAAGPLSQQANQLAADLPRSFVALRDALEGTQLGGWVVGRITEEAGQAASGMLNSAAAAATGTLGALANAVLVLCLASTWRCGRAPTSRGCGRCCRRARRRGAGGLRGMPGRAPRLPARPGHRHDGDGVAHLAGPDAARRAVAGVLGVITAVLGFIPLLGPVIAAVPAVLLARRSRQLSRSGWSCSSSPCRTSRATC